MFSPSGTNAYTERDWDNICKAAEAIKSADRVIIGIGSGMTAAGGLCYTDSALAEKWYPEYFAIGKHSIIEIMSDFWPTTINKKNAAAFWGFWARHIWHIRYEPKLCSPSQKSCYAYLDISICASAVQNKREDGGHT